MYEWCSSGSPSLTFGVSQPVVPEMWPHFCVTWLMNQMVGVTSVQTKPYLPNCPPGTNELNKEIIGKQSWVSSSEKFDIVICWLKGLLTHFWPSLIIELAGHYSHSIFDTGHEKKTWTAKSYRQGLVVPLSNSLALLPVTLQGSQRIWVKRWSNQTPRTEDSFVWP